jgi:hypothetical protein
MSEIDNLPAPLPGVTREMFTLSGAEVDQAIERLLLEGGFRRLGVWQDGHRLLNLSLRTPANGALATLLKQSIEPLSESAGRYTLVVERDERARIPTPPRQTASRAGRLAQVREEDNLPDIGLVRQHHHEPVNTHTKATIGRHAIAHGAEVVLVDRVRFLGLRVV